MRKKGEEMRRRVRGEERRGGVERAVESVSES